MLDHLSEAQLYSELKDYPRPHYPFPDRVSPFTDDLFAEYSQWVDIHCPFTSFKAREKYKQHRLTDLVSRGFPCLTLDEMRPLARFTSFFAILDDYMDKASNAEIITVQKRIYEILAGQDDNVPNHGIDYQCSMIRQEALACGMPQHLYEQFIDSILEMLVGYGDEKEFNAIGIPPPLDVYHKLRRQTSGGIPFAKYLCMQKKYRAFPDDVLLSPIILRIHDLVGDLIGYHNDFISLPKELAREGDVINLIMVVQQESQLGLKEAWFKALAIHDECLQEFIRLQNSLPDFGECQQDVQEYVTDLGVMVQGVYSWHVQKSGRYAPGIYVEPE